MITPTIFSILDLLQTFHRQLAMDTMDQSLVAYLTNTTAPLRPALDLDQRPTSSSHPHTNPAEVSDTSPTHTTDLHHQLPMGHQNFNMDRLRTSMDRLSKTTDHRSYRMDRLSSGLDHQSSEDLNLTSTDQNLTLEETRFSLEEELSNSTDHQRYNTVHLSSNMAHPRNLIMNMDLLQSLFSSRSCIQFMDPLWETSMDPHSL